MSDEIVSGPNLGNGKLSQVREGMKVYDINHRVIGKVEDIFLGQVSSEESDEGLGPPTEATENAQDLRGADIPARNFTEDTHLAYEHGYDNLSSAEDKRKADMLENRLLWDGYVVVNLSGLFSGDRYILPGQIQDVQGKEVLLNVTKDELLKK